MTPLCVMVWLVEMWTKAGMKDTIINNNMMATAKVLIQAGADPNITCKYESPGDSALSIAKRIGYQPLIDLLGEATKQ